MALARTYLALAAGLALLVLLNMLNCWFVILRIPANTAGNTTFLPILDACMYSALLLCVARFFLALLPPPSGA